MKHVSKLAAFALALAMALVLVACGGNAVSSSASSGGGSEASASASAASSVASEASSAASDASADASAAASEASAAASEAAAASDASVAASDASASSEASGELAGKPWVTSVLSGNLPAERPEAKDDLYTHYNYEYLAAHQGQNTGVAIERAGEMKAAITAIIKDESKTGHDLDQLRIFYNQAADTEKLKATGLSELQPYLDRIDAVSSLDEMNALLAADDFPFSPFILACLTNNDTRAKNIVGINPDFVLCDALLVGGTYYQESDDPQVNQNIAAVLQNMTMYPIIDFMSAGMSQKEAQGVAAQLIEFEKAHGKHLTASGTYLNADYGFMAETARESYFTLDELCAMAPNFPLKETLGKMGKAGAETYTTEKGWLKAFGELWTEDNLDAIKLVAKANVLSETRPYRDPSFMNSIFESYGQPATDADSFAYTACTSLDTLGNVVSKTYVDDVLGPNAKARIETLSKNLVDAYKDLVDNTPWMGEESQQRIIEKLDHMTLNILEPVGGYFDYSGLELTPTEKGGTLLSNYLKLKQYRYDCESKLINQPAVAAAPWFYYSPAMANAFYDPTSNSINILPGYVTSAVYAEDMTDADLLAGLGWTVGHEISHGFDYTGSQLDAYGTPNPVFTDADVDSFVLKCSTLASYYNTIEVAPEQKVDGRLVIGEAAADLCGLQACFELAAKTDGFDYKDYFGKIANEWAVVMTPDQLPSVLLDTHPISNLRVNVNAQMLDPIYDVLGVVEGDGMYLAPEQRIVIWGPNA